MPSIFKENIDDSMIVKSDLICCSRKKKLIIIFKLVVYFNKQNILMLEPIDLHLHIVEMTFVKIAKTLIIFLNRFVIVLYES